MKIGLCGDVHWSEYSSIVRKNGEIYSVRLENLIKSINWFNELTKTTNCLFNFYMGDYFDRSELKAREISAVEQINWNSCPQYFLCGNHEQYSVDHVFSSAKIFDLLPNGKVFDSSQIVIIDNVEFAILPYILEEVRKPLSAYFPPRDKNMKRVILSHNDIAGIQLGGFISKNGFSIEEIEENCDLFINGHLHNGTRITDKIINIGNITGQNFSEDAFVYDHCAFILDTETLKIDVYENPFALNFYKIDAVTRTPNLSALKNNAVVSLRCKVSDASYYKEAVENCINIIESRIVVEHEILEANKLETDFSAIDHIQKFNSFILEKLGSSEVILNELEEISK